MCSTWLSMVASHQHQESLRCASPHVGSRSRFWNSVLTGNKYFLSLRTASALNVAPLVYPTAMNSCYRLPCGAWGDTLPPSRRRSRSKTQSTKKSRPRLHTARPLRRRHAPWDSEGPALCCVQRHRESEAGSLGAGHSPQGLPSPSTSSFL